MNRSADLQVRVLFTLLAIALLQPAATAQTRLTYAKGQSVAPAYEGWWPNQDGSVTMFFGYMNSNWEEEFDIPIGADNNIEPGGPDQGQPTHFYPRRNPFLFTIRVPKDLGDRELVWTITTHGRTQRAYASLKSDYRIDKQVMSRTMPCATTSRRSSKSRDLASGRSASASRWRSWPSPATRTTCPPDVTHPAAASVARRPPIRRRRCTVRRQSSSPPAGLACGCHGSCIEAPRTGSPLIPSR